jgi:hypothetical protein
MEIPFSCLWNMGAAVGKFSESSEIVCILVGGS